MKSEALVSPVKYAFDEALKDIVRARIIKEGLRPDGRGLDEIRPIWCEVGISPRAHGSGLFTRGETQVLPWQRWAPPRKPRNWIT